MSHPDPTLTYPQAIITGLIQGVTELFPVSSLGHNVLLPAIVGGSWETDLNVAANGSPYSSTSEACPTGNSTVGSSATSAAGSSCSQRLSTNGASRACGAWAR